MSEYEALGLCVALIGLWSWCLYMMPIGEVRIREEEDPAREDERGNPVVPRTAAGSSSMPSLMQGRARRDPMRHFSNFGG